MYVDGQDSGRCKTRGGTCSLSNTVHRQTQGLTRATTGGVHSGTFDRRNYSIPLAYHDQGDGRRVTVTVWASFFGMWEPLVLVP